jgi:hypothetical protein
MRIITEKAHTVIGLVVGALLALSPMLFSFTDNQAASTIAMLIGVFIILNELITTSPFSPVKLVPMNIHVLLDVVTGVFLLVSPWLFNFVNENEPSQWVPHVAVGLLVVGYALLTRPNDGSLARSIIK